MIIPPVTGSLPQTLYGHKYSLGGGRWRTVAARRERKIAPGDVFRAWCAELQNRVHGFDSRRRLHTLSMNRTDTRRSWFDHFIAKVAPANLDEALQFCRAPRLVQREARTRWNIARPKPLSSSDQASPVCIRHSADDLIRGRVNSADAPPDLRNRFQREGDPPILASGTGPVWRNGRRGGLKLRCPFGGVGVRIPPPAPPSLG